MSDQLALFARPGDDVARELIRTRLADTMFVEAGAGSGKTAALVERIVALVRVDRIPIGAIAAITFTDKAASELRHRIRQALERYALEDSWCADALDGLDRAAICTLHSFAQRLLTDCPIEAGLPPRIQVRDEIASAVAFDTRWRGFIEQLLDDDANEGTVLTGFAAGVQVDRLRAVADAFADNWDLLDRVDSPPPIPHVTTDGWLAQLEEICAQRDQCIADGDKMVAKLDELAAYARSLRAAPDDLDRIRLLRATNPSFRVGRTGRKTNWRCDLDALRARIVRLAEERRAIVDGVTSAVIRRYAVALAGFTATAARERTAAGELEFHDLLVLARGLLRHPTNGARIRRRLAARYQRLLVDEFQDTDPIQVELAVLLASDDPDAGSKPWPEIAIEPGRAFFVGDPKQSIYRFRRADIATFLTARDTFADAPLLLTCNFRTTPPILEWVNRVFGELIRPHPGSQPEYRALDPVRVPAPAGPGVVLLGATAHTDEPDADSLREREAVDVVSTIRAAIDEAWAVGERDGTWRRARLGDVCILLPARTSLGFLERALDDAGIPYRAETSSLVYGTPEVRDLLATLRAIDDPTDSLSLVSALRSPLFGCGDDDLYEFAVEHGGRWDLTRPLPEHLPAAHPVGEAIVYLAQLHERRPWVAPSELVEQVVRDRYMLELGHMGGRFRDVARRVRFVVDQARAFSETTGGVLRDYIAWAARQGAEGSRVVETVLPETDEDAVRILTIHGAKGLEFPIVVCSGMTTRAQPRRGGVQVLFPPAGGCEIRLGAGVQTDEFELHQPVDEQMGFHEKLRLLYVGCTRARDHLVVSVHRKARALPDDPPGWTHAELIWEASEATGAPFEPHAPSPTPRGRASEIAPVAAAPPPADWDATHAAAFVSGARRRAVAATTLAQRTDTDASDDPGFAKHQRDLELPPWNKGRYGTAIGRAVHAVLQTADLASGDGIDDAAAAQAAAEGVLGHERTIADLARAALATETVRAASSRPHWRETYVAVPIDGLTLEGYVDLIYRDDDGLVVVDYKTDAVPTAADLDRRLAHYQVQGAAYALAVAAATGEPVARCVFVFLDPNGARTVVVDGAALEAATANVHSLIAAERDAPTPLPPAVFAEA
ncbi:MAG: UvrD-helicase domain-containing protein [Actinomycetota bacterium]